MEQLHVAIIDDGIKETLIDGFIKNDLEICSGKIIDKKKTTGDNRINHATTGTKIILKYTKNCKIDIKSICKCPLSC